MGSLEVVTERAGSRISLETKNNFELNVSRTSPKAGPIELKKTGPQRAGLGEYELLVLTPGAAHFLQSIRGVIEAVAEQLNAIAVNVL